MFYNHSIHLIMCVTLHADFCAQNRTAVSGALDFAEKLLQAGIDAESAQVLSQLLVMLQLHLSCGGNLSWC
jgi:hypothetical protein